MKARTGVAYVWVLGSEDEGMELDEERSANTAMDISTLESRNGEDITGIMALCIPVTCTPLRPFLYYARPPTTGPKRIIFYCKTHHWFLGFPFIFSKQGTSERGWRSGKHSCHCLTKASLL
jgi:hypothetical protein